MMDYASALAELESLGVMPTGMPSLEGMTRALKKTRLVENVDPRRNIIVAGTNGKGSVAATLSALLRSTGDTVGLYTSPHLVSLLERFRINEEDLDQERFISAYSALRPVILAERLTHFEALTLIAAALFFSGEFGPPLKWAIWEVGLGGLFDATNAIPHHPCVITRLGLDHQQILGNTLEEIALQKFGVIGERADVVHSPMPSVLDSARTWVSSRTSCRWIEAKRIFSAQDPQTVQTPWGAAKLALAGQRAMENTATALTMFEALGFAPAEHLAALELVRWPGRFQKIAVPGFSCPVYFSGDHNPQGVESLIEILAPMKRDTVHFLFGACRDKDIDEMLRMLSSVARSKLYLSEPPFKPLRLSEYSDAWKNQASDADENPKRLLVRINKASGPNDVIIVTGSLYLVGELLSEVLRISGPR